jgi:hypothetical protein
MAPGIRVSLPSSAYLHGSRKLQPELMKVMTLCPATRRPRPARKHECTVHHAATTDDHATNWSHLTWTPPAQVPGAVALTAPAASVSTVNSTGPLLLVYKAPFSTHVWFQTLNGTTWSAFADVPRARTRPCRLPCCGRFSRPQPPARSAISCSSFTADPYGQLGRNIRMPDSPSRHPDLPFRMQDFESLVRGNSGTRPMGHPRRSPSSATFRCIADAI